MPKKKTGQAKKKDEQKRRQKELANLKASDAYILEKSPANATMVCDKCDTRQRNRAFCYFCAAVQRLPQCAECGKSKCMAGSGDCLVKHPGRHVTGIQLVGAVCAFCDAWVCHSKKCIQKHTCPRCPLEHAQCIECQRTIFDHGGRVFICAHCGSHICEDDNMEHQASCTKIDKETFKCMSCNKFGSYSCLKCKISFCDDHARRKGVKYNNADPIPCPKCGYKCTETKAVAMSTKTHEYGRQQIEYDDDDLGGHFSSMNFFSSAKVKGGFIKLTNQPSFTFGGQAIEGCSDDDSDDDEDGYDDDDEEEDGDESDE